MFLNYRDVAAVGTCLKGKKSTWSECLIRPHSSGIFDLTTSGFQQQTWDDIVEHPQYLSTIPVPFIIVDHPGTVPGHATDSFESRHKITGPRMA